MPIVWIMGILPFITGATFFSNELCYFRVLRLKLFVFNVGESELFFAGRRLSVRVLIAMPTCSLVYNLMLR